MSPAVLKPSCRASDWPQTDVLKSAATGICLLASSLCYLFVDGPKYTNIIYVRNFIPTISYYMPTIFRTCCATAYCWFRQYEREGRGFDTRWGH